MSTGGKSLFILGVVAMIVCGLAALRAVDTASTTVTTPGTTASAARFTRVERNEVGSIVIRFTGEPSRVYIMQRSHDLKEWSPIATNTLIGTEGTFVDSTAGEALASFYRIIQVGSGLSDDSPANQPPSRRGLRKMSGDPPTVSITSPTNTTSFETPANILIQATASDDGSVTKVEFFQDLTKLGEDTGSPYSLTWSNAPTGSYTLTAKATDNDGLTTISSPVDIAVIDPDATSGNLAVGASATQSSTAYGGSASRAVDGNTNGSWFAGSVTHTDYDTEAWWQVDLGASYSIVTVKIWNRTDCCSDRLSNFFLLVSDDAFGSTSLGTVTNQSGVSNYYQSGAAGTLTTIDVDRTGRYLRVQLTGANYLSLAEVEVFGPVEPPAAPSNLTADALSSSQAWLAWNLSASPTCCPTP